MLEPAERGCSSSARRSSRSMLFTVSQSALPGPRWGSSRRSSFSRRLDKRRPKSRYTEVAQFTITLAPREGGHIRVGVDVVAFLQRAYLSRLNGGGDQLPTTATISLSGKCSRWARFASCPSAASTRCFSRRPSQSRLWTVKLSLMVGFPFVGWLGGSLPVCHEPAPEARRGNPEMGFRPEVSPTCCRTVTAMVGNKRKSSSMLRK